MRIKNLLAVFLFIMAVSASVTVKAGAIISSRDYIVLKSSISNDSLRLLKMEERVREIQSMDISNLSYRDKKELRNELTGMLKEAKAHDQSTMVGGGLAPGIYIPVGTLIIAIIILILVLR